MDAGDHISRKMPLINSSNNNGGFLSWLRHPQRGLPYLIFSIIAILIILPLLTHYYISAFDDVVATSYGHHGRFDRVGRYGSTKSSELKSQIDELRAIKTSVSNELLDLEKKRQSLLTEITGYTTAIEELKLSYRQMSEELSRLKVSLTSLQIEQQELRKNNLPNIEAPKRILPPPEDAITSLPLTIEHSHCHMYNCFDYSRCSITSQFPVYLYPPDGNRLSSGIDSFLKYSAAQALDTSPHITSDPLTACMYVVLISDEIQTVYNRSTIEHLLRQLPYWRGSGVNHLLISLSRRSSSEALALTGVDTGAALIAQSFFFRELFRIGYDIILPPALGLSHGDAWEQMPPLVPARRKYLMSFVGEQNKDDVPDNILSRKHQLDSSHRRYKVWNSLFGNSTMHFRGKQMYDDTIIKVLKTMQAKYELDSFYFEFICSTYVKQLGVNGEWVQCGTERQQKELFLMSTFWLIIAPADHLLVSTEMLQSSLYLALKYGSVPIILGDYVHLPFQEVIHWSRAVITLPKARVTELHFMLRSYTDADILEMRRYGRLVFETFFSSTKAIVDTTLALIRHRLHIPAIPIRDEPSPSVFNSSFVPLHEPVVESVVEVEEMLGPLESPMASPRYYRNFTFTDAAFTLPGDPFHNYPFTPFEPTLLGDSKFMGSSYGFRPIGQGAGGTGKEFSEALGGNVPREQFTVVILTYEREAVLINAISRLKGLPHLNKVVVVWNSPQLPAEDLHWPDIGVKIHVIRTAKNSLNNRFLPYDAIETQAVLSVDDDAHLRHDEIMFGFRVWREARDRIVGFPGRYHAWDITHQNWLYNSNYSCELSVVLTGAAFFHKYYMYVYSYVMPQAIRDKVDEYLNCEDLAMNFLVSHITRKPPIKVTSRWTFRCPGCPKALSVEESHFHERHKCMNFFVQVYGYMPLLNTQFRADSVLFKTRISHDKQKCFKFI